jgi:hypothetical protein
MLSLVLAIDYFYVGKYPIPPLPLTVTGVTLDARGASCSAGEGTANAVDAAAKTAAIAVKDFMVRFDTQWLGNSLLSSIDMCKCR